MKLVRNSNGCYARHFVIDQEVFKLKNKCLESKVVDNRRRERQMFVYDPKMLSVDPVLFFAAARIYSRIKRS